VIHLTLIPVSSSNVASIGYENSILEVHFHSGSIYQYLHVPETVFNDFLQASSKGSFVHQHLKDKYPFKRLR